MDTRDLVSIGITLLKHRGLMRGGLGLVAAVVLGVFIALPLHYAGLIPWFGYGDFRVKYSGKILLPAFGKRERKDLTIGFKKFYLFEGQTAFINYEVTEIIKGGVKLKIAHNRYYQGKGLKKQKKVMQVGEGSLQFKVPKSGFYKFSVRGTPKGTGHWHASVSATWGARIGDPDPEPAIAKIQAPRKKSAETVVQPKDSTPKKTQKRQPKEVLSFSGSALRTREPQLAEKPLKKAPVQASDVAEAEPAQKKNRTIERPVLISGQESKGFVVIGGDRDSQ